MSAERSHIKQNKKNKHIFVLCVPSVPFAKSNFAKSLLRKLRKTSQNNLILRTHCLQTEMNKQTKRSFFYFKARRATPSLSALFRAPFSRDFAGGFFEVYINEEKAKQPAHLPRCVALQSSFSATHNLSEEAWHKTLKKAPEGCLIIYRNNFRKQNRKKEAK